MRSPIAECSCICRRSSSVSAPGFSRRPGGRPILPMSWTRPQRYAWSQSRLEAPSLGDVSRVDRDCRGMTRRVAISRVERRDERCRELKVRAFERFVCFGEVDSQLSLLLVQAIEPLSCHRGTRNNASVHGETSDVHEGEERNDWRVDRRGRQHDRNDRANGITDRPSTDACSQRREENIKYLADDRSDKRRRNQSAELRRDGANVACAANPIAAPPMNRVLVYVAHLSRGARSGSRRAMSSGSPSIEAAPTTPAASGPNNTAANRSEAGIDCSSVDVSPRSLPRNAR